MKHCQRPCFRLPYTLVKGGIEPIERDHKPQREPRREATDLGRGLCQRFLHHVHPQRHERISLGIQGSDMNEFVADGTLEMMYHPQRWKILQALDGGVLYIEQIAEKTGIHPRMVSHHVSKLESKQLVLVAWEMRKIGVRNVSIRLVSTSPRYRRARASREGTK